MLKKEQLNNKVVNLQGEKVNELISFMLERGIDIEQWTDIEKASDDVLNALSDYFGEEVVSDVDKVNDEIAGTQIDFNKIKELAKIKSDSKEGDVNMEGINGNLAEQLNGDIDLDKNENGDLNEDNNTNNNGKELDTDKKSIVKDDKKNSDKEEKKAKKELEKTKKANLKRYKTMDNLVELTDAKETVIEDVTQISETSYGCYLNGSQLADMFLEGNLIFDPTMQRGVKEDKDGNIRANFRENQITGIYKSMMAGTFTPTQIRFAVIIDDEDVQYDYSEEDKDFTVLGKLRLLDGQHRCRTLAKIKSELDFGDDEELDVDIDRYIFNVIIDIVTSDEARIIYTNIDKNLKLDKSQVRQLSADHYARIVNTLNTSSDSDLRGKIATAKPVADKLVLFHNLANAIQSNIEIKGVTERKEITEHLINFFNYVTSKLPQAFGDNDEQRKKFKTNNLLNENNFFPTWIKVALMDKENYEKNIDKIVENVSYFDKTHQVDGEYIWLKINAVKHKVKGDGFAMNNTSTGIKGLENKTLELLGYEIK